jgi:hypothetical protein
MLKETFDKTCICGCMILDTKISSESAFKLLNIVILYLSILLHLYILFIYYIYYAYNRLYQSYNETALAITPDDGPMRSKHVMVK